MSAPADNPWAGRDRRRPHPMPGARRVLMLFIVLGVLVGFTLLVWLGVELKMLMDKSRIPTEADLKRAADLFKIMAVTMTVCALGIATWIAHFAWRVRREQVYPPPGSRHLSVRRVLRGAEAQRVAYMCYALAGLLALAGLALTPIAFHIMESLRL